MQDGMGEGVTLLDGCSLGDPVPRVHNNISGTSRDIWEQHGLDGHVHGGNVEGLQHDLTHLLMIGFGVQGDLCQQHGVFLGGHMQLVVEGVVADLLHIVTFDDDAMLDGILQGQYAVLLLA